MTWKRLKKFEDWNIALVGLLIITFLLVGIYLGAKYGFKEEQKKYPLPTKLTAQEIKDNLFELFTEKDNLMRELYSTNLLIEIYSADYEARQNGLSVKYQKIGDSIGRIEYNESVINDITFSQVPCNETVMGKGTNCIYTEIKDFTHKEKKE
jgi:hypothetical protein